MREPEHGRSSRNLETARGDNTALLAEIGARVRNERAKRGMTRRALAAQCQTSERYLAQIEAGAGNPSVLVLDAIARALDLDPIDLLPGGSALRALRRLPPKQLTALMHSAERRDSGVANRARRIALIGLRGAGKSTLGDALAERARRAVRRDRPDDRAAPRRAAGDAVRGLRPVAPSAASSATA